MADLSKSTNKKPVSLNHRLLQDLSAPPKQRQSATPSVEDGEEESVFNVKLEGRRRFRKAEAEEDNIPNFGGITDFDSSPEEKPTKVKIEGRRRLCKVSFGDNGDSESREEVKTDSSFDDIADFDSPIPSKNVGDCDNNRGINEIKDILNDLTSRLDLLSIEKRRMPENGNVVKKVDVVDYASAESSFSSSAGPSDSSSNVNKNFVDAYEDGHLLSGSFADEVDSKGNDTCKGPKKNEYGRVDEKLVPVGKSFASNVVEEEGDVQIVSDRDDYATRVEKTNKVALKVKKKEPTRFHEKLRSVGRSSLLSLRDESEDKEDDCEVLTGKKVVKKVGRPDAITKYNLLSDESSVNDVLDNQADSEDDSCITLPGPKSTYKLSGTIAKMLYPHQREGLRWLWSLHCQGKGGILGDDMGLGKTMQICSFLAGLFHSKLIKRALVVAPKTLLSHWIKELSVVGLSAKTREYFGTSLKARDYELQYILQDKGILLTTYDIVRNNSKSLRGDHYFIDDESEDSYIWDYMILDEGHLIKNPSTQRAKSLLEIPSAHCIVISGTPIQNNLKELWALFNFCCPGLLGDNKWFKETYEHPILRGNEKNASDREKRIGSTVAKELRERIQPYFLRRMKNEVFKEDDATTAKLSRKNEIIVWLRLTACQRQLYEAFLRSEIVLSAFDGSPLAALTILKKICDHPLLLTKRAAEDLLEGMESMLNPEDAAVAEKLAMHLADVADRTDTDFQEKHDNISCKISFILSLLDNLIPEGHNVLIFSQTRKMLNLIQESLVSSGYEFIRIDGTTKATDRAKIVSDFQEGNGAPIFLLTSQVGGLGLTLTKADRVIVVDPAWNPSTDNQSVDRAYRIGQMKDVVVYRLMTCGTVEEKIYRKQIFKGGLFRTATENKEQIRYFSQQDLRELFSLPKQGFDISLTQQQLHEEHDSQHKMDEFLESHIKFLETQGIAGVSHHSLLFSKTATVQVAQKEEDEIRKKVSTMVGNSSSSYSLERDVDGAVHAFNPKDVNLKKKSSSPDSVGKLTESEIKERINRLSQILGNKATISRLPDQGAKLQKQIGELNSELNKLRMEKATEREGIISLDDLTGEFERRLNV
ncbi:PREDICTED: protein CHROMATIN REMODELING 24-like isoform X2 [Populus euphratica]|uniref:Protein CHROMATIN REMODELING 24-like isoform X2 n=1 Tax=Populus euphratica TaxID=75702 RepID=A0AAJ6XAJ7_POPEU|nr:PREDICTED: protein CHROMATIN REMODELING 24-like isoform X2 [Populus euphratica]